jgi:cytochrome c oxidase subunit 4
MSAPAAHDHAAHEHRPVWQYLAIAVVLTLITAFELGPLFGFYHLPPAVLIVLSAFKFFTVVAFYMHLWDDHPIFTRLFAAPLIGAAAMITVLMLLHHTFFPSPHEDAFALQERYRENWNGPCYSWLRSHE